MIRSPEIQELAKALSAAQGAFTAAERAHVAKVQSKKGEGSSYSYNYADLQAYLDVVREPLAANGLSFVQLPSVNGDAVSVVTLLLHSSGQFIESDPLTLTADHDPDKRPTPQAIGSTITYCRRYSLSAITGMASEADDDAVAGSGLQGETAKREPKPDCPACGKNMNVYEDRQKGGYFCWKAKGGCGHNWLPSDEAPNAEPKNGAKAKADKVAAEHGIKTADQLEQPPKSGYQIAVEKIKVADTIDKLDFLKDWVKKQHDAGYISEGDYLELGGKLGDQQDSIEAKADVAKVKERKEKSGAAA